MQYPPLLKEGIAQVRAGKLKPSEWATMCCNVIEAYDSDLKAWSYFNREQTIANAKKLDDIDWAHEEPAQILAGAPLGVKDIFNTVDHPNSMGTETRKGYWPGNDARVVTWAKLVGAQMIGKTTTAEFAVHWAPETLNPRDPNRIAGTSSTGTAVAVATGMVPAAFGTQSAGSIARPASYNGIVGFKPSFGLIPRTAILKTCDTLDTVGWMTRNIEDAQLLLHALRVKGDNFPIVERGIHRNIARYAEKTNFKVGVLKAPGAENIAEDIQDKMQELALQLNNQTDIEIVDVDLQSALKTAHETHATIYDKSLAYYFQRELKNIKFVSPLFQDIVDRAAQITPEEFFKALDEQERLTQAMEDAFEDIDFMILPTTADEAVLTGETEPNDSSLIWTLTGVPSLSLPLLEGRNGHPVGVTVIGPKYSDMNLLEFARQKIMPETVDVVVPQSIISKVAV